MDSPPVSNTPGLLESLTRLDERLARIEQRLDQLEQSKLVQAAPAFAAIAVDSVDEAAHRLQERGVDLEARMSNALATLERLTSDQATAQLSQALELAGQVPNLVSTVMDTLDRAASQLQERGVDLDARAKGLVALLERVSDPKTVEALLQLLTLAQSAPDALAALTDSFDQRFGLLHERGIDLEERLRTLARIAERLTAPEALKVVETLIDHLPSLDRLLDSGLLGKGPIQIVSLAGQALTEAQQQPVHPLGAFGLLRALSDSGVQHSLGFAVAFARELGRNMEPSFASHALPNSTQ
jgi:uncharacterized protein YjgD (DUF1641 family)